MEYGLPTEDITRIKDVFKSTPKVEQVILFGSRAMGNYKPGSDIDLAVIGKLTFDDILDICDRLERIGLLYKFDVQNLSSIKDADVLDHIHRVGKVIY